MTHRPRYATTVRPVGMAAPALLLLLLLLSLLPPTPAGHIIRADAENAVQMLDITKAVLEAYGSMLSLLTAGFVVCDPSTGKLSEQ